MTSGGRRRVKDTHDSLYASREIQRGNGRSRKVGSSRGVREEFEEFVSAIKVEFTLDKEVSRKKRSQKTQDALKMLRLKNIML